MIGSLGMPEILFILVLALLVFGPKRLPQVGRTIGKGLREFRRATTDLKRTVEVEMNTDEPVMTPRPVQTAQPAVAPAAGAAEEMAKETAQETAQEPTPEAASEAAPADAAPESETVEADGEPAAGPGKAE